MTMRIQNNTKSNCRLRNLISVSHLGAYSVCARTPAVVARRHIALAVSFMTMMSTKYVALRLIGTVINVGWGRGEKYVYTRKRARFFL